MDEQRAEFEAWAHKSPANLAKDAAGGYQSSTVAFAWRAVQAATQRQQDRIAELEADIAHKDAYAEQLGRLLFKAGAERQELEAQVQALSVDAERYRFLRDEAEQFDFPVPLVHITDRHGRVEIDDEGFAPFISDMKLDKAIDAAIAAGKGEG